MIEDPTENFHGGNQESTEAFESVTPGSRAAQLARVVAHIASCGPHGATSDEVEAALGLLHQGCSARFTDAKRQGLIIPSGHRRPTRAGRMAAAFIVPPAETLF
jgi:hypothetical protein